MKKIALGLILILLNINLYGCSKELTEDYTKYNESFLDTFDTVTTFVAYTKNQEEFNSYYEKIHSRYMELHKLYDKYNDYEGINNIKTINDNAGIKPVKVSKELLDLIIFSKDWYYKTKGKVNIALGPVLEIWHDYREEGMGDPANAKLPPIDVLKEANKYTDIEKVIVDTKNSTVYLPDSKMSIDVGAVAKGYATEIVINEVKEEGLKSGIISAGGNVRTIGKPLDDVRERWGVGIQDPEKSIVPSEENLLDVIFTNDAAVVTSGDYQRYYIVDDKVIHHIIDPETLFPGNHFRAVSVISEDAGMADILSTTIFLLSYEEGIKLVDSLDGVEAVWMMGNGETKASEGMKKIMKSHGASGANAE